MARGLLNRTYRLTDDGEHVEGTWRHVFIHNGPSYFLTDLKIYADGLIDCWGLVNLEEFKEKVRSGWVATTLADGGEASAHHLASWKFSNPHVIGRDELIREVEDTIAELQGAPSSADRFNIALDSYLASRSEEERTSLRAAYQAIPSHMRRYILGDQDMADWPVRVLIGEIGETLMQRFPPFEQRPITEDDRARALRYFEDRRASQARWSAETNNGDPDGPPPASSTPTIGEGAMRFDKGFVALEGDSYLANDTRIPVTVDGAEYPSVAHAYWAISTDDVAVRDAIRNAGSPSEAREIALRGPRRTNWPEIRLAVMADLVRAKFEQHPDLANRLKATGTARIRGIGQLTDLYWRGGGSGRNWMGRLLEVVRSELWLKAGI